MSVEKRVKFYGYDICEKRILRVRMEHFVEYNSWNGVNCGEKWHIFNVWLYLITGISGRSQILFALTYTTRYLDLLTNFVSLYNTFMKVVFLAASYATLWLIYMKFRATYDQNHDTFR